MDSVGILRGQTLAEVTASAQGAKLAVFGRSERYDDLGALEQLRGSGRSR